MSRWTSTSLGSSNRSWGGNERLLAASGVTASSPSEEGQGASSSSAAAPRAPPKAWESFKKRIYFAKRNAHRDDSFIQRGREIVEDEEEDWEDGERRVPRRRDSRVDQDRVENTEQGNVTAGVARTIYRLIMEGHESAMNDAQSCLFNEEKFIKQPNQRTCRFWCCKVRQREPTPNNIFELLQDILRDDPKFQKELLVICTIYLERLLYDRKGESRIFLSKYNWQPILVTALLLASKVWEDAGPWNMDFIVTLRRGVDLELHSCLHLYTLELMFSKCIDWDFCVSGEEYGRYMLALRERDEGTPGPLQERSADPRPRFQSFGGTGTDRSESSDRFDTDREGLDTIDEDPYHLDTAKGVQVETDSSGAWSVQQTFNAQSSNGGLARQKPMNGTHHEELSAGAGLGGNRMRSSKSSGMLAAEEDGSVQASGLRRASPPPSSAGPPAASSGMRRASRSSGNLQETAQLPQGGNSGLLRAARSSGHLSQEGGLSGMRRSAGSSGHLNMLVSQDSGSGGGGGGEGGLRRNARSHGHLGQEAAMPTHHHHELTRTVSHQVPGMVRRRSYGRLTEASAPPAVQRIQADTAFRELLGQKENWLERKNPLLGFFRHALPAGAPSRHIGVQKRTHIRRLSNSMKMSMSCSTFEGLCLAT